MISSPFAYRRLPRSRVRFPPPRLHEMFATYVSNQGKRARSAIAETGSERLQESGASRTRVSRMAIVVATTASPCRVVPPGLSRPAPPPNRPAEDLPEQLLPKAGQLPARLTPVAPDLPLELPAEAAELSLDLLAEIAAASPPSVCVCHWSGSFLRESVASFVAVLPRCPSTRPSRPEIWCQ